MKQRQQNSTTYPISFLLVSSTDHVSPVTGLGSGPVVTLSKNGAAFGAPSGAISEIGSGWYSLAGNATDRNTLGELVLHATGTGADPADDRYVVVPWNPFDANLALSYLTGDAFARLGAPAAASVSADVAAVAASIPTAAANADALLDRADAFETGWTLRGAIRVLLAALGGKVSGAAGTTILFRNVTDTKTRITASVDSSGNRTAVTLDPG